jgi:uroporphyrinogen-III synthase
MSRYKILSTKNLKPSLVNQLKAETIDVIEKDFISINPVQCDVVKKNIAASMHHGANVVFTSANAVEAVKEYFHEWDTSYAEETWKIYCLSGKTKEAVLEEFSQQQIVSVADNASWLVEKILQHDVNEVIFFCGDQRREELPCMLKEKGVDVTEIIVYNTIETPATVDTDADGVLFFSPSAVRSFFSKNELKPSTICFAIGNTTKAELQRNTTNETIVADSPSAEAMVQAITRYFKPKVQ